VGEEVAPTPDVVTPDETEPERRPDAEREPAPEGAPEPAPSAIDQPPDDSASAFVRDTAVMSVGTALSRITGFLRLAAAAYALGITESRLADTYNIANITPNIIYELALGGILTSVVVPVLVDWLQRQGREEMWDVARRLLTFALVGLSIVAVIGIVLAPWIIDLYTSGVGANRQEVRELATFFLRWFMPQIVFYGVGAVATGLLNAHRRFAVPMFAPILNNLIVIATFVAFALMPGPTDGSLATSAQQLVLAIGTTAGVIGMTLALFPAVRALGFRFHWRGGWRHPSIVRIGHLAKWVLAYVAVNQLGYLVVIVLANRGQGWYTTYASAFILFQLPHAIVGVSIFTALLPAMSGRWSAGDVEGFRARLVGGIRATAAIMIPAALGYLVLARPIVRLLLEHGVVTPSSGELVSDVLVAFSLGLFAFSAFQLLLRAFYSMQDTRTPALVNVLAVSVNVIADLIFFFWLDLGVQGLALGHATAYTVGALALFLLIRRRTGGLEIGSMVSGILRSLVAGGVTAGVAWLVARGLGSALGTATLLEQAIQVFGAIAAGLVAFVATATLLRIEEVAVVRRQLAARWGR
jgi:putative peptidoglycan lipid II flippase